ncbi:MAG: PQQ-binding-like beta-propeller repeat protein [Verrucomicrobia bacterium]|nr:PQQ-binding-like beta-propeller repeat protein [Verrucomicrobiota bacterium]
MKKSNQLTPPAIVLALALASVCSAHRAQAGDWPHWLGPNGDNIAPAGEQFSADLSKWKVAWKANVGRGYSAVVVAGDRAFTVGHDEKAQETVYCFDANTGEAVWKHAYDAQLLPNMHPGGPNATPTVFGSKVFTLSKDGQAYCLDAAKGSKIWQANLVEAMGIKLPRWGFASSAVIDDGRVIFTAGKVAAFDLATGKTLWTSKNQYFEGYTTAVVFEREGEKFIAALDGKGLSILTGKDGEEIARHPFKAMFDMVASTPIVLAKGNRVFISGNTSSEMVGFDGQKLTSIWASTDIKNAMNNSVVLGGVLYGIDGKQGSPSRLVAVNVEDGKVKWAQADFAYGTTIGIGKTVLAFTENGELISIKAASDGYSEISRRQVLSKTCWTTPVYGNQRIYVRNDRGELICLAST